ncbi:hypothetical protein [Brevundimonas vesicularis]|uniref:hypothetical protein n=1 Tax=Brevundimonas vesicularis TaxID=41276 RepID=UPI0038D39D39
MKKSVAIVTGLLALGCASAASAQSLSPSSGTGTISSSTVVLSQSTTASCFIGGTYTLTGPSGGAISPTMSGGLCNPIIPGVPNSAIVRPYGAWSFSVKSGSTTSILLTVGANTVLNKPCYGTVEVPYNSATKTLTFSGQTLPPVTAGDPICTLVSGTVTLNPGVTINP